MSAFSWTSLVSLFVADRPRAANDDTSLGCIVADKRERETSVGWGKWLIRTMRGTKLLLKGMPTELLLAFCEPKQSRWPSLLVQRKTGKTGATETSGMEERLICLIVSLWYSTGAPYLHWMPNGRSRANVLSLPSWLDSALFLCSSVAVVVVFWFKASEREKEMLSKTILIVLSYGLRSVYFLVLSEIYWLFGMAQWKHNRFLENDEHGLWIAPALISARSGGQNGHFVRSPSSRPLVEWSWPNVKNYTA